MSRKSIRAWALSAALMILVCAAAGVFAQDAEATTAPTETPTPTEVPQLSVSVSGVAPNQFVRGVGGTLTIIGENFTPSTTVSLNGTTLLTITSQTASMLTVLIGADIGAGTYNLIVADAGSGTQVTAASIVVLEATSVPQLSVTQTEPSQITAGQSATLSVLGTNFSDQTTVRLVGFGFLATSFVNSGALTAAIPSSLPAGGYTIEVSDPSSGTASAPGTLLVLPVVATSAPVATSTPTPTATTTPGQPRLVINTFSASPANIMPGGTTTFTIEVLNVGSRTAEGVVISLGSSTFSPANGQASVTLPNLASMASAVAFLSVTAPSDAAEGPQNIELTLTSRDFSGQTYTNEAAVSVNVLATPAGEAQIVLHSYVLEPTAAAPGDTVVLRALFTNTGSETAEQVLVALEGANGILLAGADGGSFAVGDMPAGAGAPVVMSFVVSSSAESGAQPQALAISYLQDGEPKTSSASISLDVAEVTTPAALLLLESYSSGQTTALQPGQQFAFEMTLQNAGLVDVSNLRVTFGTVESESSGSSGSGSSTQASPSSTTTASTDFAIYGSGNTILIGDFTSGATTTLVQNFIVASDLASGIHELPLTLQYTEQDGTETQQALSATLLVVVPPRLRISAANTLDDPLTAGEEASLSLDIANLGSVEVALTEMRVSGDNAEISEGALTQLDPLQSDDDSTPSISFMPQEEGSYTITVEVDYIDDLNRTQTLTQTFTGQVEAAQRTRPQRPMMQMETVEQESSPDLGSLLLGFLGFGG